MLERPHVKMHNQHMDPQETEIIDLAVRQTNKLQERIEGGGMGRAYGRDN